MDFSTSYQTLYETLQANLGERVLLILGAIAILLIGTIIAIVVRATVLRGLRAIGLNKLLATGTDVQINVEHGIAGAAFAVILLLTMGSVFSLLNLSAVSEPISNLTQQLFEYAPELLGGIVLTFLAWLLATLARAAINRTLSATTFDDKFTAHTGMSPVSNGIGSVVYWLIILLFVPLILGALKMDQLLLPVQNLLDNLLSYLPNLFAAVLIAGSGWILAKVLRDVVSNLLKSMGVDNWGEQGHDVLQALDKEVGSENAVVSGKASENPINLSSAAGTLVFVAVFVPAVIAALGTLKIKAISDPATHMLDEIFSAVPNILAATAILVGAWLLGKFAFGLMAKILNDVGFDNVPAKVGLDGMFVNIKASHLVAKVAFFFTMLFSIVEAANLLGMTQVSDMVSTFTVFGGDVLLGSVIMIIGFWLANLASNAIACSSEGDNGGLAKVAKFTILALVIAMGLRAMGVANDIVNMAFAFSFGSVAVAVALSFGLGGREAAGKLLDHWLSKYIDKK